MDAEGTMNNDLKVAYCTNYSCDQSSDENFAYCANRSCTPNDRKRVAYSPNHLFATNSSECSLTTSYDTCTNYENWRVDALFSRNATNCNEIVAYYVHFPGVQNEERIVASCITGHYTATWSGIDLTVLFQVESLKVSIEPHTLRCPVQGLHARYMLWLVKFIKNRAVLDSLQHRIKAEGEVGSTVGQNSAGHISDAYNDTIQGEVMLCQASVITRICTGQYLSVRVPEALLWSKDTCLTHSFENGR